VSWKGVLKQASKHGLFFFAFQGTYAGGRGGENGPKLKLYSFFLHWLKILDAVLNWILMGEGVKNDEKSKNSIKNCIKSLLNFEIIRKEMVI